MSKKATLLYSSPPTFEDLVGTIPANFTMLVDNFFSASAIDASLGGDYPAWNPYNPPFPGSFQDAGSGGTPTVTITNAAVATPFGASNGTTLVESSGGGNHLLRTRPNPAPVLEVDPMPIRAAFIAKAGSRTRLVVGLNYTGSDEAGSYGVLASVGFDLAGGNVGYDVVAGSGGVNNAGTWTIPTTYGMVPLGGGYWLCWFDAYSTLGLQSLEFHFYLDNGSGTAARSISYTGDGASGLDVYWATILPSPCFSSFNNQVFFDDFLDLSTIDIAGTLDPSKNWFRRNEWNSVQMTGWGTINAVDTAAAGLTAADSILTWDDLTTSNTNYLWTAHSNPSDQSTYSGRVFDLSIPALFEARMSWAAGVESAPTWPAFWGQTVELLTGTAPSPGTGIEVDFLEHFSVALSNGTSSTLHTNTPPDTHTSQNVSNFQQSGSLYPDFVVRSCIWVPHTASINNNDTGLMMSFDNGNLVGITVWTPTSDIGLVDNQPIPLILGGGNSSDGTGWPTYFDWVKVTQLS